MRFGRRWEMFGGMLALLTCLDRHRHAMSSRAPETRAQKCERETAGVQAAGVKNAQKLLDQHQIRGHA